MSKFIERHHKALVFLFFASFFCLGVSIHKDYGLSFDEPHSRRYGLLATQLLQGDRALYDQPSMKYHGTFFEMTLIGIEKSFRLSDPRDIYFARHLSTFLVFYLGVIFFYFICSERFRSWKMGLVGSAFLILSPRILADAFYNSKDLSFLSIFIISIYTLIKFLDRKTLPRACVHALVSAILIDIRVMGVLIPCFTVLFSVWDVLQSKDRRQDLFRALGSLCVYLAVSAVFTVLFWPILWENPVHHFMEAWAQMSRYYWPGDLRYLGDYMKARDIPWHYILVWIAVSTPLVYGAGFVMGVMAEMHLLFIKPLEFFRDRRNDCLFLMWFFVSLAAVIVQRSVLYDGWRHLFYIYPALILLALIGFESFYRRLGDWCSPPASRIVQTLFLTVIFMGVLDIFLFMVKYHPHQNVYFNRLAGGMERAKKNFELDYWGLSYRKALEYILKNDPRDKIKVFVATAVGRFNALLLEPRERERLIFVTTPQEAQYFMSNYRGDNYREDVLNKKYSNEYYSIKIDGTRILVVYRLE